MFERGIEQLRAGEFVPQEFSDGCVSGTYRAEKPTSLLLTIPYDKGWTVTVDGTRVELSPAFGGGMSVLEVTEGTHEIEMTYRSPGLIAGCIASGAALSAIVTLYTTGKRKS